MGLRRRIALHPPARPRSVSRAARIRREPERANGRACSLHGARSVAARTDQRAQRGPRVENVPDHCSAMTGCPLTIWISINIC